MGQMPLINRDIVNRLDSLKEICPRAVAQIKVNLQHTSNRDLLHWSNRNKIKIAHDNEQGGRDIRGDQVNNDGRIVIDETVVNMGCNCNPSQLPDNSKCSPCRTQKNILINYFYFYTTESKSRQTLTPPSTFFYMLHIGMMCHVSHCTMIHAANPHSSC